jgi:uncharacterized protein (TIGR00290 family)
MTDTRMEARRRPVVVAWSGGKDSALALQATLAGPELEVVALLTTIDEADDRVGMHGVARTLVEAQADAVGLPLTFCRVPRFPTNARYEEALGAALAPFRDAGVSEVVYGDLFLEDVRAYRETLLARLGMTARLPLWGLDTAMLARRVVGEGWRATLCTIDPVRVDVALCGRAYDAALLAELPRDVDPCGERGEFHTFVHDGPVFRRPLAVLSAPPTARDGFYHCELTLLG